VLALADTGVMDHALAHRAAAEPAETASARALPDDLRAQLERSYAADLSHVRVLEDGAADSLGKVAAAYGSDLHFARGNYDPSSPRGRHVIAHEVAHVVQQGAAPTRGSALPADPHVSLEHEADAAAVAALCGLPARLSRGRASVGVQGYAGDEHWLAALIGSHGRSYKIGDFEISHSDICAIAGDYFDPRAAPDHPDSLLRLASTPSPQPGCCPGTQDEIIAALKEVLPWDKRWAHIEISDDVTTVLHHRYNRRAVANIEHFARPGGAATIDNDGESAGGSYRHCHESAVWRAYRAGETGGDNNLAGILEAGAEHYLTDAFAAGHERTPRAFVQGYWDMLAPDFKDNLVETLTARLAREMSHSILLGPFIVEGERGELRKQIRYEIKGGFGRAGVPGFGEIVSLLMHHEDNDVGLASENDVGWRWTTYGDGTLAKRPAQLRPIIAAVELSCNDVDRAYALGHSEPGKPRELVLATIRATAEAPARMSTIKYAAEQLMPRPVPGANGMQSFMAADYWALLDRPIRDDVPNRTFGYELGIACRPGGTIYSQFAGFADAIPDDVAWGFYTPREAFEDGILAQLAARPLELIGSIIYL
jgi:hypothetical protein